MDDRDVFDLGEWDWLFPTGVIQAGGGEGQDSWAAAPGGGRKADRGEDGAGQEQVQE